MDKALPREDGAVAVSFSILEGGIWWKICRSCTNEAKTLCIAR